MPGKTRQRVGLTLSETVVSMAIIAIMVAVSIPAARILQESLHSSGAKSMISGAFSAARALAARHQRYAGIRFQFDPNGNQYMIFILHDQSNLGLANGFRAIEGLKPVKLPEGQGVMESIGSDVDIDSPVELNDKTTFSIIFTPAGKLVIHDVQVRNKDGQGDSPFYGASDDEIFNKRAKVDAGQAMFYQDDYVADGYKKELSVSNFIIYNKNEFSRINGSSRWTDYLRHLKVFYINSYTGTIIE